MKTYAILSASALIVASMMKSASALQKYCEELPNGAAICQKETGHVKGDTAKLTALADAFSTAGTKWSNEFCMAKYAGDETMTNGAVFGDPCCKWKKGGKADFVPTEVIDGTKKPVPTVCANSSAKGGEAETGTKGGEAETGTKGGEAETGTKGGEAEIGTSTGSVQTKGETSETPYTPDTPDLDTPDPDTLKTLETPETPETQEAAEMNTKGVALESDETQSPTGGGTSTTLGAGAGCAAKKARKLRS